MITHVEMQAVRAFDRVIAQSTKGWAEAEACDSHWDAGEWSQPAWATNWEKEVERVTKLVAERFGIYPRDLSEAWEQVQYDELHYEQQSNLLLMLGFDPALEERL